MLNPNAPQDSADDDELDERAHLWKCLTTNICPICKGRSGDCDHLLANIDLSFQSFDAGSLRDVYFDVREALQESYDKKVASGEVDEDEEPFDPGQFLDEVREFFGDYASLEYESNGEEGDTAPSQASVDVWYWGENVEAIRQKFLKHFMP